MSDFTKSLVGAVVYLVGEPYEGCDDAVYATAADAWASIDPTFRPDAYVVAVAINGGPVADVDAPQEWADTADATKARRKADLDARIRALFDVCGDNGGVTKAGAPCRQNSTKGKRCHLHR